MPPRTSRIRFLLPALVLPALLAVGCKKKPPAPAPPPVSVEARLQVVSISPQTVEPDTATPGRVMGSAFEPGATVTIGSTPASDVVFLDANTLTVQIPALAIGAYDVTVTNPDGGSSTLRSGLRVEVPTADCPSVRVFFDFDKSFLTRDAKSAIDGNASCYQAAGTAVRVEGHADERGTIDYNLALGQRRADSVKRHLMDGGISGDRITTVSFGEERPLDGGHNEAAWALNRRADLHLLR